MNRLTSLTAALFLTLFCAGCGDSHESLTAESIATMKSLATAFEGIKDVDSAKAAKPKLEALVAQMNDLQKRQQALPTPTEAEGKALLEKYGKEMQDAAMKMQTAMMRVGSDPALAAELEAIATKMPR